MLRLRSKIITAWAPVRQMLETLGFWPDAGDAWIRIGVLAMEGPPPSAAVIETRWEIARLLFSREESPAWDASERDAAIVPLQSMREAADLCL